jgi:hypothetical protein
MHVQGGDQGGRLRELVGDLVPDPYPHAHLKGRKAAPVNGGLTVATNGEARVS